jgi:hypothetical protein
MHVTTLLEVRSRIELAQGHLVKAEDTLDEFEQIGKHHGWELMEKSALTRARLHAARGERDEAIHILKQARDHCFDAENLHHFRKLDQELARLLFEER